jgi:two-component sensor histidine kinase/CHASE1-domain containing sensor protein
VQKASRLRRVIPVAIFSIVLLMGLALAWALHVSGAAQRRARMAADVEEIARAVEIRMGQNVAVLRAVKAMIEIDPGRMTRERFSRFVSKIDLPNVYPGIRGLGFAARIPVGAEQAARARYELPRDIFPQTSEEIRAPVALLEPRDARNEAALGFDMFSEPRRRAAMVLSETEDQPVATAPVILAQEIDSDVQNGFLVYLPTRDAQGAAYGFAYAPFRVGDFLSDAGVRSLLERYALRVDDVTTGEPAPLFVAAPAAQGDSRVAQAVNVASRVWRIALAPISAKSAWIDALRPLGVALLALLLAALVAHAYRDQQRAQETESALSDARLKALADREVLLQEMNHRIKNAIARIAAIARSTARGSANLDEFQTSFFGRLAAMAAAQDLVTKGGDTVASLDDLLRAELDQIFPQGDPRLKLDGPPTQLDGRMTQALALVLHELATNAAKHGAARDPNGALAVRWRRHESELLTLEWIETCAPAPADPARKGFGSRLVTTIVEGELRGRVERELRPQGLRLLLEIPKNGDATKANADAAR